VLTVVSIQPYDFYKVIEVVIRAEARFSQELIRHLNFVEQEVILYLAWAVLSPRASCFS
jgi:hypothetical protein